MTLEHKTWMNLNEASTYLSLSQSFIRRLVSESKIEYTRSSSQSSKLIFKREWLDAYLEAGMSTTAGTGRG
jgi:excisionase family DNA binding protein